MNKQKQSPFISDGAQIPLQAWKKDKARVTVRTMRGDITGRIVKVGVFCIWFQTEVGTSVVFKNAIVSIDGVTVEQRTNEKSETAAEATAQSSAAKAA
jgi:sRNA-binding regulator protein Hfq